MTVAGTLAIATIATPTSAQAQWGRRGWGLGLGGLALGLFIGAALSRPAYAYGYGYPAYSYGYGPAYGYASSGYGYGPEGYASYGYGYPAYSYASYGYPAYGYGGGYYRPADMVVIDQPTVPPSTEAIGWPAALRSTALVGAEPLVRKHVAYASTKPVKAIDRTSSRTVGTRPDASHMEVAQNPRGTARFRR